MTSARRQLIYANATPFYHVINRCVRRAFLCGEDKLTGRSYERRRGWVVYKIKVLPAIFLHRYLCLCPLCEIDRE
jgi:hypothetical protein